MAKSMELRSKLLDMYAAAQPCNIARKKFDSTLTEMVALCMLDLMLDGGEDEVDPELIDDRPLN